MGAVRFSHLAQVDLQSIASYTLRTWGETQTVRYLNELEDACEELAESRIFGRPCDSISPGLRRREQGKHVIFFRRDATGILVSRILHERMLPARQSFDD